MLDKIHSNKTLQYPLGFLAGIIFGFLLQKGGVTRYEVIINQLLLTDFTVLKVMLSAMLTGMFGVYLLRSKGLAELHPKSGSLGSTLPGALIFGIGFGILGYCPGTAVGAVGQGSLDALAGGLFGITLGAGLYAAAYPKLKATIFDRGGFGDTTVQELLKVSHWTVVLSLAVLTFAFLFCLEYIGF